MAIRARGLFSLIVLVILCVCAVPSSTRAEATLVYPVPVEPRFQGRIRLDYDYQALGSAHDSDLSAYWNGDVQDVGGGLLDFYFSGKQHRDFNGTDSTFWSLDGDGSARDSRLLQGYLDAHDRAQILSLRAGRQYITEGDSVHIDGARAAANENGTLAALAYYGRPVSYYTSTADDRAGGVSLVGRPWTGSTLRLTLSEYDQDDIDEQDQNTLFVLEQSVTAALQAYARASILNGDFRMAGADLYFFVPETDSDIRIGGTRWGDYDARTRFYMPYNRQLGKAEPYSYLYARGDYSLDTKWMLSPGISTKRVDGGGEPYANENYIDYDLTLTFEPTKALSASLSLQYWDMENGNDFTGLSGEVRYRRGRVWEVSVGSYFADYYYTAEYELSTVDYGGNRYLQNRGHLVRPGSFFA